MTITDLAEQIIDIVIENTYAEGDEKGYYPVVVEDYSKLKEQVIDLIEKRLKKGVI